MSEIRQAATLFTDAMVTVAPCTPLRCHWINLGSKWQRTESHFYQVLFSEVCWYLSEQDTASFSARHPALTSPAVVTAITNSLQALLYRWKCSLKW